MGELSNIEAHIKKIIVDVLEELGLYSPPPAATTTVEPTSNVAPGAETSKEQQ